MEAVQRPRNNVGLYVKSRRKMFSFVSGKIIKNDGTFVTLTMLFDWEGFALLFANKADQNRTTLNYVHQQ